ncbi:adhesin for cattle intestine colonization [Escherichia coli]|nr:adhesin for cattle intestine colonization [Escherichia coli]
MSLIIDVISRKTSVKQTLINPGDVTVVIYEPSVVQVHAQASVVARYVREGNDLLIYMQDGTVIRCNGYFLQAANTAEQSELVFADGQQLTHVTFADTAAGGLAPVELTAQTTAIESIAPFLDTIAQTSTFPWGWLAGAAVGGGALGALLASGGDGDSKTEVINNPPPPAEPGNATPSFLVTDNQGDQRGILATNDITDDTTPTFSGSGQAGATIQIKDSNGNTIASTQVDNNGQWSVSLPTQSAGEHTWSVVQIVGSTITDAGSITLTIDNSQASVQVATTAGDNIINASEQAAGFTLSGTSSHLAQGTELTVTLNGKTYTTSVGANGAWSVQVPTADAQALGEGNQAVLVSGKDATGNTVTGAQLLTVDTQPPTLAINTIAQDNIISAAEHNVALVLSGTSNAEAGQTVTLTVNGKSHTATVGSDGTWQVTLPATEVQALAEGNYAVNASVSDRAGNSTSHSANFTVDTSAPVVSVNTVAGDDILNNAEQAVAQIISGQVSGASPGDTVTVKLGATVLTGVVLADGTWNVALDPAVTRTLARGPNDIIVTVTDAAGNTGTATHNITLVGVAPQVAIDAISGDNVLNALESQQPLTLSGTSNLPDGGTVNVTLNNVTYSAQVSGGVWSLSVPVSDVVNLANTNYTVTASATDVTGNTGTAQSNLLVDTVLPQVIINTFAGDNIVNNAEAAADQTLSGVVVGAAQGDTVTIELGGNIYTATVGSNLTWSVNVPAADLQALGDGALTINASVTTVHGNTGSSALDITISAGLPGLRIDTIAGDDVINAVEQQQNLIITGSSTNLPAGRVVTVLLGGNTYQGVTDSNGNWQVGVPAADLQALTPGTIVVNASATDPAGNPVSIDRNVEVNPGAVLITINTVSGDDIINAAEKGAPLTLTGTRQLVETGQTVVVKFAGQTFTTTVQAGGGWSLTVPASAVSSLADGAAEITATVTNISGNTGDTSRTITVDSQAPALSIDPLTADNIINAAESGQDLPITGTTDAQPGQTVTVTLNGQTYQGVVQSDGTWSVTVPAANVGALADGNATVTASVNDVAGNPSSVSRVALVDATPPVVTINPVATDNVINTPEHAQAQIISGTVTGAQAGDIVTVTLNNVNYTTVVDASGNWSLGVPASVVSGLADGSYPVSVSVTDRAGNTGSQSLTVTVDTAAPVIGINTIAGDDVINASEKGADLQITGTSDQPANTAITVTLNGQNYTTTTDASGNWSVTVPASAVTALGQANYTVTAAVTSGIGNSATASGTRDITIDANLPGLRVDTVAGDDVVNIIEHGQALVITGSSSGLAEGTPLTVTINNVEYTTAVQADGSWSVGVTAVQVSAWPAGTVNIAVSGESSAENPVSITHPVMVDLTPAAITINTIATDDVINATEKGADLTLSGTTTNVEAGQTVTVTFGGKNYTATVASDGSWTATVPAADLAALPEGSASAQASVSNINGNSASAVHNYSVDSSAPTIIINTVASDNIVNASEADAGVTVSGSTTAEAGQIVTVTLNSPTVQTYQATVQADGSWSINIPAADLEALTDGSHTLTATVNDKAGNPASTTHNLAVDLTVPVLTINTMAGDDIINAAEHGQALVISGSSTGGESGDVVSVTLNNKTYTTTLDASGNWSVGVPAADVTALGSGPQTITASLSDRAGNSDSTTHDVTVDLSGPTLTINTVSDDDIINSTEKTQDLIISGGSSGLATGTTVTVMLNGLAYSATTDSSGNWSVTVPASAVGALGEAVYSISASATDSAGNSGSTTHTVNVESLLPGVIINTVAGDDIINAAEIAVAQTISGQVTGTAVAGNTVIVTIGGNQYTATVQSDLSWSVSVPANVLQALGNGELTISASVTNSANNTGTATRDIVIDANLPGLRVDTVAGDDVINSIEHTQALVVTGSSSGLAAGAALTVVINSVTYGATVLADGSWSVGVPAADVTNWPAGTVNIAVSGTNTAGTTTSISHPVTVDLATVAITINTLSTDDVINAAEKGSDLQLSGTTSGVEAGQTITVIFGGKSYTTTVAADNTWGLTIPAADLATLPDGAANIQASVSNVAGNNAQATHVYSVDATAPSVTINTIASDDILNAAEAGSALTISGTSTAEAGQTVTVTLNGVNYSGNVQADGSWSVSVPTGDLADLTASPYTVSAAVSDKAGNPTSATHNLTVDLAAPVVTINTVAGDDIINATEHAQAQIISGSATGATTGNTVSVAIGTTTYTTVLDANGNWSIGVPASVISALAQGDVTITATVTDSAGNSGTASHTVSVALGAPILAINTIAVDDIINATEKGADLSISGTSNQPAGTQVTVTLNGQNYTTTADASGNWSVTVPASRVSALGEATYTVTAAATDADGNSGSASHNVQVNTALPGVTINVVATDDIINAAEAGVDQTISGQVTGATAGDTVTVTLGGATYTATVQANLSWSVDVPAAALQALGNGELTISASVTNSVGNTGNGTREITIDANLPGLRVDTVAGDDVVNIIEHGQALVITGSSSGLAVGSNVTLTINGQTYVAAVLADGTWSVGVPAVDVSAWPAGALTITASGSTTAGNPVSVTHPVTVDLSAVAVSINAITADDVINAAEKGAALTLTGSTSGVEAGQTVTVTFGGKTYTASVAANGSWSTTVPAADMAALRDGDASAQASVSNVNGNSATTTHAYSVDASAPTVTINTIAGDDILNAAEAGAALTITGSSQANLLVDSGLPGVTINTVAGDDIINAAEAGADQTISGVVTRAAAGDTVTVTLGGNTYTTTVQGNLSWSVSVPAADLQALGNGDLTITASVTNANGNTGSGTRDITIDANLPGLRVDTVAGDDIVNSIEHGQALVITGGSSGLNAGAVLTVTINSVAYSATVQADGSWSVGIPAANVSAWPAGPLTVEVAGQSSADNPVSVSHPFTVDLTAVAISINTVASDDVINAAEKGTGLTLSGSTSGIESGQTVTVTFGGKTYTASVAANGSWSVNVPAGDLATLPDGAANVQASVSSASGNSASATHAYSVDASAPTLTINTIASDDILNATEAGSPLTISGTSTAETGQTVTVTLNGATYTGTVQADGSWSVSVPTSALGALTASNYTVSATVNDKAGNPGSASQNLAVDTTAPVLTINTVAGDDIINDAEHAQALVISGTSTAETGQTLTVTLNGTNYQTTVQADGSWSLTLPASDLTALANNGYTLTATVSDQAGNPGSASKGVTVDTTAPVISFNTVAGDDVINNVEHTQAQIISGTATGAVAGDRLVVTIAGQQYVTSTDASGNWSVGVPASVISGLADGTVTISATITDSAGNSSTQTHNVQVNTAAVSLSVSTISGDNLINAAEAGSALTLSGTGTNFAAGTVVTVLLNGKGYSATIQNNGSWSVNVPAADVAALADGTSYTVSASAQDSAGNSATASRSVAVDLTAPVISINTVSTDDRLNAAEQQQPLTLNGSTSAEVGQTVTVTFGGKTYTATVAANGTWALNVPAADLAALGQGAQTITASVNDRAGNPGQTTHALTVDTVAPTVTIATVAGDDIINNAEQLAGQTISGTTTAEVGQTVTVTFNGQTWTATVGSGGSWSVFIPAQQFAGLSDGSYTISATVSDQAGNPGSASRGVTLNGDVPSVTINTFAGDDVVNAAEHGSSLVISGTTTAPVGQTLTLTLNGKTYTTTVQTGGSWSYTLGSADVTALADGNAYVINASVSNAIGNTGSSNHTITVDLSAPAMGINIDSLQADTGLSASDFITSVSPVVVNGSLTAALASNETAQISIDGGVTWTTLTVTGTTWRYNDSRTLTDGNYLYQVRVIDTAGNVGATDSQNVVIDTIAPDPAVKTIAISAITTDTGLITNDFVTSDTTLAVSGTLGAALSAGEFAQISIDGGSTWQNLSVSGLTWTYLDGRTLTDGNYNYQVRVIDTAGNIGATASQIVTVDTTAPLASKTIAIAGISDDTGLSSSDFVTRDTTLTVRGTLGAALAADERAQISLDGGVTWTTLTVIGTNWSYADGRTLTDGTWNYTVRVVDLAGNVGQTATQNVVVDTTSPEAAKSITITGISDDTGASSSDFITSDTTLTVRGVLGAALGANEFAQISTDNGATWVNVTLAADGLNWSYVDGRTLTNGTTTWQVRVVDLAGNVGATGSQSAQIDTVNPAQVLTIASISTDTGSSATDFITSDTSLTLTGSLGAGLASGEVAQISLDGGATWTTLTTNGTQWTYTDSRTLTDGSYVYQVRVLDLAGNTGPVVSKTVVVDTINPTATPTIVSYTDDVGQRQGTLSSSQATDDTTPLLNGVLSAPLASGEVVYLYRNGLLLGAVTMVGALNWTYSDSGLVSGAYTYSARVVDLAGNITSSSDFVLTVDTSIPTTLAQITSQTTRDTTPIISGVITAALASGQYVEVVINGKTYTSQPGGAVVVDPAHNTWYVQLPDTDTLAASATAYNVTAQVKSSAGNGNTANVSTGTVTVNAAIDYTPTWTTASKSTAWGLTYGLDSHGMWTVLANQQVMQSTDPLTWSKTALTLYQSGNNYATSSIADYDRNGTGDLFITRDDYSTGYINGFTNNGDGTFSSAIQVTVGTLTWYGSIVAFDKEGDGYLDFWIGDAGGPDSNTFLWNNAGTLVGNSTTSNSGGSATVDGAVTGYLSLNEGSGVDLNNDGRIDLVQHTFNLNNYYTLSSLINQGNGTFVWGQNTINTFLSTAGSGGNSTSVSMTWADFDGDGDMDLFLPAREELTTAPCYSTPTACWVVRWRWGLRQPPTPASLAWRWTGTMTA